MKLRYTVFKGLIDILILAVGLLLIYTGQVIEGDWVGWLAVDGIWVLIIVFGAYLGTVAFVEILLVYMRQDTWFAKMIKSLVAILLVMTVFPFVLFGLLWLFGYGIEGDVVPAIMLIAIVRTIIGVWLGRIFKRRSGP